MNGALSFALFVGLCLLCLGGLAAGAVLLVLWGVRRQRRYEEALREVGFEPVTKPSPDLARGLLALAQFDEKTHSVDCRNVRREAGYAVFLQAIEPVGEVEAGATWRFGPAVHAPGLGIPLLTLVPKSVGGERLARWASRAVAWKSNGILRPVAFPEDPAFESLFEVLGGDETALRDYLHAARRASLARMEGLALAGNGDLFSFERYEKTRPPTTNDEASLRFVLEDARALLGILGDGVRS